MSIIIRIVYTASLFISIIYNPCIGFSKSMIQNYCPFTTLCTDGPRKNFTIDDNASPCCSQCDCDEDCWKFGTCCPDANALSKGTSARTVCQSNLFDYSLNVVPDNSTDKRILKYLMITSCPSDYTDLDTIEHCVNSHNMEPDSFDDIVTVSDVNNHDRIYNNKYCAACNGVTDVIRWNFKVINCLPSLPLVNVPLSQLFDYYMTKCDVISDPGIHVVLSPLSTCYKDSVASCNETGLWQQYDKQIDEQCHLSNNHFIYRPEDSWFKKRFRNLACFVCNQPEVTSFSEVCLKTDFDRRDASRSPLSALIDLTLKPTNRNHLQLRDNWRCSDCEVFDDVMGICREVKCQFNSSPYYGKCYLNTMVFNGMYVAILVKVVPASRLSIGITPTQLQTVYEELKSILRLDKCKRCDSPVYLYTGEDNSSVEEFTVMIKIATNNRCQLEAIADGVADFDKKQTITLQLDGINIEAVATIDFLNMKDLDLNWNIALDWEYICGFIKPELIGNNLKPTCPYVTMTMVEYIHYVKSVTRSIDYVLQNGTIVDDLLPGFFSVPTETDIEIGTCVDNMLTNSSSQFQCAVLLLAVLTLVSMLS